MVKKQHAESHDPDDFVVKMSPELAKRIIAELWKNNEKLRPAIILAKAEIEYETGK
jgi:hypothetical protein